MTAPYRVQLSRRKGWKMPPNTVRVARPGRWGNPYSFEMLGGPWKRKQCVDLFEHTATGHWSPDMVAEYSDYVAAVIYHHHCAWLKRIGGHPVDAARSELRGKNLGCWCPLDRPCHADVLLKIANA